MLNANLMSAAEERFAGYHPRHPIYRALDKLTLLVSHRRLTERRVAEGSIVVHDTIPFIVLFRGSWPYGVAWRIALQFLDTNYQV